MGVALFILGIGICIAAVWAFFRKGLNNYGYFAFAGISIIVALVLEALVFNYTVFDAMGKGLKESKYEITYNAGNPNANSDDVKVEKKDDFTSYEITNINKKVGNVEVKLPKSVLNAEVNVFYKDSVFSDYNKTSNEAVVVQRDVKRSEIIRLNLIGKVKAIKLEVKNKDTIVSDEIVHDSSQDIDNGIMVISLNEKIPFEFNVIRFLIVLICVFIALNIYEYRDYKFRGKKSKNLRRTAIIALLALQIVFLNFLSMSQMENDTTDPDGKQDLIYTKVEESGANVLDQYHQLTLAFAKGQLYLDHLFKDDYSSDDANLKVLKELEKDGKVYNPNDRDNYVKEMGTSYRWDEAYYKGHFYTYYGAVPVVFIFLPFYLITGCLLTTRFVTFLLAIALSALIARLVYNIAKRRKGLNMWTVIGTMAMAMSTIFVTSCFQGAKIYELSPMSGLVLVLAGINCFYRAVTEKNSKAWMWIVGALCMALSVGCKPTFIFASVIVGIIVLYYLFKNERPVPEQVVSEEDQSDAEQVILEEDQSDAEQIISEENQSDVAAKKENRIVLFFKNIFAKHNLKYILYMAIPYAVVGLLLMLYNYGRFDSFTDFGVKYQLTLFNTHYYALSDISKLPVAIYNCLLSMPDTKAVFPFLTMQDSLPAYNGFMFTMAGVGIMAYPIMWLLFAMPRVVKQKMLLTSNVSKGQVIDKVIMVSSLFVGLFLCYASTAMGGASFRYALDYGWAFTIPVVIIVFALAQWGNERGVSKTVNKVLLSIIVLTIIVNILLSIGTGFNETIKQHPDTYYRMYHMFMFWR